MSSLPDVSVETLARVRRLAQTGDARRIRESAGISLRDLAVEVGVDPATVLRWERGEHLPRRAAAHRYGLALGRLAEIAEITALAITTELATLSEKS